MCTTCREFQEIEVPLNLDKKQITSELSRAKRAQSESESCTKPFYNKGLTKAKCAKRANRKAISRTQISILLSLDSPLKEQYERTLRCNEYLFKWKKPITNETKYTANYCGKRWCPVCGSKNTAEKISSYEHSFNEMIDPQFVTLTVPAVTVDKLKKTIRSMPKTFALCKDLMRKKGYYLTGIRKIESEWNEQKDTFNPHFHIIVDGIDNAIELVNQWLKHIDGSNPKAQSIIKADKGTLKELFKYTTKQVSGKRRMVFNAQAQDAIYRALNRVRTFQSFGNIKKRKPVVDPIEQDQPFKDWIKIDSYRWDVRRNNWYNTNNKPVFSVSIRPNTKAIIDIMNKGSG
jgi:hypothetical protein